MKTSLLLSLLLAAATTALSQHITTIAGNGTGGYSGDGSQATSATLNHPFGIAADRLGYIYFADRHNNRIRMVAPDGNISTIAGTDSAGYNGDEIAATSARLNDPTGVSVDAYATIYIADKGNHRVRVIMPASSQIVTFAGTGISGFSGDGGPATAAQLNQPRSVVGDVFTGIFIADQGNNRVRKIDLFTGIITTVAGNGSAGFSGDGGQATAAALNGPYGLALDDDNNLYICDVDNQRIRKVTPAGIISTVAGNGTAGYNGEWLPATTAQLNEPIGVAIDSEGGIIIADGWNNRIRKVTPGRLIYTVAGTGTANYSGDGGPSINAELNNPYGVCVTTDGFIVVSDYSNNRIRKLAPGATGINTQSIKDISLYPNPANNGQFTIAAPTGYSASIYDISGRLIEQNILAAGSHNLPTPGIYTVIVTDGTLRKSYTVIYN